MENDFADTSVEEFHSTETTHGRVDQRSYYICPLPDELPDALRWKDFASIGMAINNTQRSKGDEIAVRYFILNKEIGGVQFAGAVRGHWGIENSLHWQLDVMFGEDQCRIRKGHRDENSSTLRRTALSLLKQEKTAKCGVKNKRLNAGWDNDDMEKLVFAG